MSLVAIPSRHFHDNSVLSNPVIRIHSSVQFTIVGCTRAAGGGEDSLAMVVDVDVMRSRGHRRANGGVRLDMCCCIPNALVAGLGS